MKTKQKDYTFPSPIKYNRQAPSGRDYLGQQSVIQNMADRCLPSFTNSTRRLRYYSFWAWAFYMAKNKLGDENDNDIIWRYLLKLENALIIANNYNDPDITGLPGVTKIPFNLEILSNIKNNDDINLYSEEIRTTTSYSPVQYSPSLNSLNILHRINGSINISPSGYGNKLARIFDKRINKCDGYEDLISPTKKKMKWSKFKSLIKPLTLKVIAFDERELLMEVIEQNENRTLLSNGMTPRVNSILLLLDIIKKIKIDYPNYISSVLYNDDYSPPPSLINIYGGFKVIEVRRDYQLCIESILSSFCNYLVSNVKKQTTFQNFVQSIVEGLKDYVIENKRVFTDKDVDSPLDLVFNKADKLYRKENYTEIDHENTIYTYFNEYKDSYTSKTSLSAIFFLCTIMKKLKEIDKINSSLLQEFMTLPHDFRHSLNAANSLISACMKMPFKDAIEKMVIELVLKLHLVVSQDKMFTTGNFTFRFTRSDNIGFTWIADVGRPNMTRNKLISFVDIIKDAGLIEFNKNIYKATDEGRTFIKKYNGALV